MAAACFARNELEAGQHERMLVDVLIDPTFPWTDNDTLVVRDAEAAVVLEKHVGDGLVAAKVHCVFVFPLPPPTGYLRGIQDAGCLRQYCLEAAFFVKRFVGQQRFPASPLLGRCNASGFSEGGKPLHSVVAGANVGFPELKEVYGLDIVPPSGVSSDNGSYQELVNTLAGWHGADAYHHVRMYTHFPAIGQASAATIEPPSVRQNSGAVESQGRNATFVFLPINPFWTTIHKEVGPTLIPTMCFDTPPQSHRLGDPPRPRRYPSTKA